MRRNTNKSHQQKEKNGSSKRRIKRFNILPQKLSDLFSDDFSANSVNFVKRDLDKNLKILYIDIETSPIIALTWGCFNQYISPNQILHESSILCYAAKWEHSDEVIFDSVKNSTFKNMMKSLHDLLSSADVVIHYNGKKFDMKRIDREFIKLRLPPPERYHQVDLLDIVKGVGGFDSNKLEHVSKSVGIGQKIVNAGMPLWKGCMIGDDKAWEEMEEYNRMDTELLQYLYHLYLPWIRVHPNIGVFKASSGENIDRPTCTNCGSGDVVKKGKAKTKTQYYQRYRCKNCGTPLRGRKTEVSKYERDNILVQEV